MGKPEGQRRFRKPRHRWGDDIKMVLPLWSRFDPAQSRERWAIVKVVINFRFLENA